MNDIATIVSANPVAVLTDARTYSEFYAHMKAEADTVGTDVSTLKGRTAIRSMAHKVTRTKTAIDDAGKKLSEEARAKINAVDTQRRKIREELDALADAVRKPLTDWEDAEKAREGEVNSIFGRLANYVTIQTRGWSSDHIREHISDLDLIVLDPEILRDRTDEAIHTKSIALGALNAALDAAIQAEADAAELAKLRAEREAREIADRMRIEQERLTREAAEREAREKAEYAEIVKRQAEAAEKSRRDQAEREARAVEQARQAEIAKAKADQDRVEREAAERVAKAEAEADRVRIEADRAEKARLAIIEQTAAEERARQADRAHRSKVMGEAKSAIIDLGVPEDIAKKIVLALVAGEIPHTKWVF